MSPTSTTAPTRPPPANKSSQRRTVRIGQYELLQTLGTGSFGKVKLAVHSQTGHKVAMKIINRKKIDNMDMGGRVKREIQYLKLLRHPHIIKLYEVISTPTDIIMVIEYAGNELFNYIVDRGRMEEDEARRFFQQIICAVEYCHRHSIVHRDLKPENLLLDEYYMVKIADFGLSNIMTDGDFLKTSCGSPNYAAPEVISGKLYAGPEIDIWSCGVILYVMLCGRLPFDDDYIPNLFKKINGGIYHLPTYLSPEARHLLSSMLVVDPVKRITIPEIRSLPWFNVNLPLYLHPLPPTPSVDRDPGFTLADVAGEDGAELVISPELGVVDPRIVDELVEKMAAFSRDDIWDAMKAEGENQFKVAYQLVRDHRRMIQDSNLEDDRAMESFLAVSPPAWNAGLEGMDRSSSIRRKRRKEGQSGEGESAEEDEEPLDDKPEDRYEVLNSSLPEAYNDSPAHHLNNFAVARSAAQQVPSTSSPTSSSSNVRRSKAAKWHFGIRSRSPPMEVMLEIYRTLKALGMEWKKKDLPDVPPTAEEGAKKRDLSAEEAQAQDLFFIETRSRIKNVIIRMDLQLYRVDASNYLVDFRLVDYFTIPPSSPEYVKPESENDGAAGNPLAEEEDGTDDAESAGTPPLDSTVSPSEQTQVVDVCSPFLFLECACRLIVELAGAGG